MSQQDLLDRLETDLRNLLNQARTQFSQLGPDTLRQRRQPEAWNILECFAHLNQFYEDYLPQLDLAIHKAKARRWMPGETVAYKSRGRRAIRRADPENGKQFKSPKACDFIHLPVANEGIKSFIINSERLLRIIQAARTIDINRASVKKARSWVGKYTVGNLLEFLIVHADRHLRQARQLLPHSHLNN